MAIQQIPLAGMAEYEKREVTLLDVIQRAISTPDMDFARIQQLLDLKERWDVIEAKKAFVAAMAAFKNEAIRIDRDKENKQYNSRYVSLGNLVTTVTPYLSRHGLSARWDIDQSAGIRVTCVITHAMGHSESVSMTCPPDKSGAKNPIQEIKSAITYAKACTFESICGLASTDSNLDDDGNGSKTAALPEERYTELIDWIQAATNLVELRKVFEVAYREAKAIQDKTAMEDFTRLYNARKKRMA